MRSFHCALSASVVLLFSIAPLSKAHALPDVAVFGVDAPEILFLNRTNEVSAEIANIGTAPAHGFYYRVVLSRSPSINLYDDMIVQSGPVTLGVDEEMTIEEEILIPDHTELGEYYVGFILDPERDLDETNRLNNAMPADDPSRVAMPAPDLRVSEVRVGTQGAAGETLRVNFSVENAGNLGADFEYGVYLSHNEIISKHDSLLYQGAASLEPDESAQRANYVALPAGLPAGTYYLGVIADPEGDLEELDKEGNVGRAALPLEVEEASLSLATSWVPQAMAGQDFAWRFVAMGGTGNYEFEIESGELPQGMELDEELGEIHGRPEAPGEFTFVLQVSSGGLSVTSAYILQVVQPSISLTFNTEALPPALHQQEYRMRLGAVGGQPPYRWTASSLPDGIELDDDGLLHGEPSVTGTFPIELRVRDETGQSSRRTMELRVVDRGSLAIITGLLPPGMVGQGYSPVGMEVMGATGYVTWSVVDGNMPPGVSLEAESGIIRGIPEQTGRFSFRIRAHDEAGLSDINSYTIEVVSQPVSIVTHDALPARVGEPYEQDFQILPGSGTSPYEWSLLSGRLPSGLFLDREEGIVSGSPEEGTEGLYTFGLEVTDSTGAHGMRAYVLEVRSDARDAELAEQPEVESGCAAGSGSGWLLGLALLFLAVPAVLGRRRLAAAGAVLALLVGPGEAMSGDEWSYSVMQVSSPYDEISGGNPLTAINGTWDGRTRISLPFSFEFYGEVYDEISVSTNGFVGFEPFTASHFSNHAIPNSSAPNGIVALWWDDLDARPGGAEISTKVLGSTPNRVFVIQWKDVARSSGSQLNFQLRLYEGTTTVEVHYGSFTGSTTSSASAGVEDQDGVVGVEGLTCTPNCGQSDFPDDSKIVYATLANLVANDVYAPSQVWSGVPAQVSGSVTNVGGEDAAAFDVMAVIAESEDEILDGIEIGRTRIDGGLTAGESADLTMIVEIPEHVASEEDYWISLIPNPDGEVDEAGAGTNSAPPTKVRVGPPMPNLRVMSVAPAAQEVTFGDDLSVSYEITNSGNLPAQTNYWIVLSTNEVITTQDLLLHEGDLTIMERGQVFRQTNVAIPENINSGAYYIGVIVDPHGDVFEPDVTGNARPSDQPIAVIGDELVVLTPSLPAGRVGRPYDAHLLAAGSQEPYRWTVASGELPSGLELSEDGRLEGQPEEPGEFGFQVLLRSGGFSPTVASYQIIVDEDRTPLTFVSGTLPSGTVGLDYNARLYATGGEPPYVFSTRPDLDPPPGLAVADDGRVLGIPTEPGSYDMVVEVADTEGTVETVSLNLEIGMVGHLLVTTMELPPAMLGEEYGFELEATGGLEPYRWAVDGAAPLPEGLSLGSDGIIHGVPEKVGVYDVVVTVRDDRGHTNSNTFSLTVGYSQGLTIITQHLSPATGGWEYDARLEAWGGQPPYRWGMMSGSLPDGLSLNEETGVIGGIPVDDGVTRHVPFIVQVEDDVGRSAVRALSISIGPAPPVLEAEGCSVSRGRNGLAGLFFVAAAFLVLSAGKRRRPSSRGGLSSMGLLSIVLLATAPATFGCGSSNPCEEVECPAGTVCSQDDGECRCGGPMGELCEEDELCDQVSGKCVSTDNLCEGLACSDGLACDPDDGVCKCGGAGGAVCGEDEWCDPVTQTCVAPDPCAGVTCAGEEHCDPETGQCLCGDSEGCPVGERCEDGQCVVDRCYGVTCAGGTVCNPDDGTCRCGDEEGPLCDGGEVCDPSLGECLPAAGCAVVACPAGMSCDPNDGLCKCGGSNGIACHDDQYCDPRLLVCLGGDPCQDVECAAGTTCDPEDGLCRCGGFGGEICEEGEWCLEPEGLDHLCSASCSPVFQDCVEEDSGCYYDESIDRTFCYEEGTAGDGAFCNVPSDCEPGFHCHMEGDAGRCRQICDTAAAYPQPGSCHAQSYCDPVFSQRSEFGICVSTGG